MIALPSPDLVGSISLERAMLNRQSVRSFSAEPLTLHEVGQLLWAAQGEHDRVNRRIVPSAGAIYPLNVYLFAGNVDELQSGIYAYLPSKHAVQQIMEGDMRRPLMAAALQQQSIIQAPVNLVLSASYGRMARRYGGRAERYIHMEIGHAGQNIYLQAVTLGLGTVAIGAFHDEEIQQLMAMGDEETPLYIMPVGKPV